MKEISFDIECRDELGNVRQVIPEDEVKGTTRMELKLGDVSISENILDKLNFEELEVRVLALENTEQRKLMQVLHGSLNSLKYVTYRPISMLGTPSKFHADKLIQAFNTSFPEIQKFHSEILKLIKPLTLDGSKEQKVKKQPAYTNLHKHYGKNKRK